MSMDMNVISYVNPFSSQFQKATHDFHGLQTKHKVITIALTILAGLASLFLGGIAAFAVFRVLVDHYFFTKQETEDTKPRKRVEDVSREILAEVSPKTEDTKPRKRVEDVSREILAEVSPIADVKESAGLSVVELMNIYSNCWSNESKKFHGIPFDPKGSEQLFKKYNEMFAKEVDYTKNHGFIEKKVVNPGTKVYVRADIHGDLKSLIENLKALQLQGLLDENYKCKADVHLVFLGDYVDRGDHSLEVLLLLACLRMENYGQVSLIRGNHEYLDINMAYGGKSFINFLAHGKDKTENKTTLFTMNQFYETMPLTLYLAQHSKDKKKQYVQFTHGAFDICQDPASLLASEDNDVMEVPIVLYEFSDRIKAIEFQEEANYEAVLKQARHEGNKSLVKSTKLKMAAKKIKQLSKMEPYSKLTPYNWGDMADTEESSLGDLGTRQWKIAAQDVKHYFHLVSTPENKVKLLFRGHQHQFKHHIHQNKLVVSTLPVGMDSVYKHKFPKQRDGAYVLTTAPKVKDWKKIALQRKSGESKTTITNSYPIKSVEI